MTQILFAPDEDTLLFFRSPLSQEQLLAAIRTGEWQPPAALAAWLESADGQPIGLHVTRQGCLVILTPLHGKAGPRSGVRPAPLSPRQRQVLRCLAQGMTDAEIAAQLHMHRNTVQYHLRSLKHHFGTLSRMGPVLAAAGQGLLHDATALDGAGGEDADDTQGNADE